MKEGASPEVLKARESRGKPRVGRVRGSGPCRGVIERPGGSRHDTELSSTCYTTTEAPVIAHHAKLGGLRLAPKGPAIQGGAPPIKEKKGRGVNWFTYRVAFV